MCRGIDLLSPSGTLSIPVLNQMFGGYPEQNPKYVQNVLVIMGVGFSSLVHRVSGVE